jgi:hypothetical protein
MHPAPREKEEDQWYVKLFNRHYTRPSQITEDRQASVL